MFARIRLFLFRLPLLAAAVLMAGCDLVSDFAGDFPKDPKGTLERVRGGTLRAGVIHAPPWVEDADEPHEPGGPEAEIVRSIARELGAEIRWVRGAPDRLLTRLREHELDILIGGFEESSPALRKVAKTRPYGREPQQVLAVPPGENAWLVTVDRALHRMQQSARNAPDAAP